MEHLKKQLKKLEEINQAIKTLEDRKYLNTLHICDLDLGYGPTDRPEYVSVTSIKRDLVLESLIALRSKLKGEYNLDIDDEGKIHSQIRYK